MLAEQCDFLLYEGGSLYSKHIWIANMENYSEDESAEFFNTKLVNLKLLTRVWVFKQVLEISRQGI